MSALSIRTARFLGEGWTSRAYLVNNELVFRFPKRAEDWLELEREIAFLAIASTNLSLGVPDYLRAAPESTAAPYGYAVYRYLSGRALELNALSRRKRDAAADLLATFLLELHHLHPTSELNSLLPREDPRLVAEDYLIQAERQIAPKLQLSDAKALRDQFETYLGSANNFRFKPSVTHADLGRDHILVEDDAIVGVIDFGDVSWGDPDYDFMYLFIDFGLEFVGEVARRYGHPDLENLASKLLYFAIVDQIGTILEGPGRALEGQQETAWRRLLEFLRMQ
ncbi:MAG TPA: aminoglycoside phosphotransferase family protein [Blastocatellia bacterium]|nr:aminoglycoside phosphotransferase family protein [Blastocatellia bacterium]